MVTTYAVVWAHGGTEAGYASHDAAADAVRSVYPDAEIGHDGDATEGGESTLCWRDAASSVEDPGVHAVAQIRVRHAD